MLSSVDRAPNQEGLRRSPQIVVMVPCYNEASTIAKVVSDFRQALPDARIVVFDNNSQDRTGEIAAAHGAELVHVSLQGKGNVVRRMFADLDADVYLMVDGDGTYHAPSAPKLIGALIDQSLDMVIGSRVDEGDAAVYRPGHRFGNRLLTGTVASIFGGMFTDMLSGYRAFSRRFAKSFPALTQGFEIETELTIHALELRMPFIEMATPYGARPEGSHSKLSTYRDGLRILRTMIHLYMSERPLWFFSAVGTALGVLSVSLAIPVIIEFMHTGLVPRFPTAILATGIMLSALLAFTCGFILDTVTRGRQETKRLFYLQTPRFDPNRPRT